MLLSDSPICQAYALRPKWKPQSAAATEMEMMLLPQARVLAQRLLAHEGGAEHPSGPAVRAAFRVCDKLRRPVIALAGVSSHRLLLSRALTLAKAEAPGLATTWIAADESLQDLPDVVGKEVDKDLAKEGGVVLLTRFLGLLLTSIGETATLRLVTSEILPPPSPRDHAPVGFESILNEADQLQGVSVRLAEMAEKHPAVTGQLLTVAGSVLSVAALLNILVTIKSPRPN